MHCKHPSAREILGILALIFILTPRSEANQRHFTYNYESGVLAPGQREAEFWTTWRNGRANFYSQFEHRAEFEFGVTDRLMTSVYLNWKKTSMQDPTNKDATVTKGEFQGLSSEWKYKLLDPVADPVGLALYQEYSAESNEFEWENKLILDKRVGDTLLAYNLTVEPGWTFGPGNRSYTIASENTVGATQFLTSRWAAGLELRNVNENQPTSTGFEYSALFVGPVVSYSRYEWWIALSWMRQLPALKKSLANPQDKLILDEQEKNNIRILASIHF